MINVRKCERKETSRFRRSDTILRAEQTERGSCFKEVFCYSFEICLEDVGLTPRALITQMGLLVLIFWA